MKIRIKKLTAAAVILIAVGVLYLIVNRYTGFAVPCAFHLVTGLNCPGCGVSRMFISLFALDFKSAFKYNAAVMVTLPLLMYLLISLVIKYIRHGSVRPNKFQNLLIYFLIGFFLVFAVLRNIPAFDFLAPC